MRPLSLSFAFSVKVQPQRIEDYVPGESTIAKYEQEVNDGSFELSRIAAWA